MNKKGHDVRAVDDFATANTNRLDVEESTFPATSASSDLAETSARRLTASCERSNKQELLENRTGDTASSRKDLLCRQRCSESKGRDDQMPVCSTVDKKAVLPGQVECSSSTSLSPSVLPQEKVRTPSKTFIAAALLPTSSECPSSGPSPSNHVTPSTNTRNSKGVGLQDDSRDCRQLPISNNTHGFTQPSVELKNSHKTQAKTRFHVHHADDMLSVISEESLTNSVARRCSSNCDLDRCRAIETEPGADNTSRVDLTLQDPWVRSSNLIDSSSDVITSNFHDNSTRDNSTQPGAVLETTPVTRNRTRIRFRSESQDELENIETNTRTDRNKSFVRRRSQVETENRERERNDIDLLSRPSWCDAKFALSRIEQGKANGNKAALKVRAFLHCKLFWIGCYIQRNASVVLLVGIIALTACAIGLKFSHMETNIEKLWVESGGKLEEELKYTREAFETSGISDSSEFSSGGYADSSTKGGSGYSYQMLIQTGQNTLTSNSLKLHLKAALAATKVTVTMYNQTWGFSDVCFKEQLPMHYESEGIVSLLFERLFPCFIITPLDCFWEGAKLLGPNPPILIGPLMPSIAWTNLNPLVLLDENILESSTSFRDQLVYYRDVMQRAGITSGYTERWCLDPYDVECPQTAPNFKSKQLPNLNELFTNGCSGFATKYMRWPLDLIVGGVNRGEDGNVTSAQGLQTLFSLMGKKNMYEFHKGIKTGTDWSLERAGAILQNWERQFAAKIYKLAAEEEGGGGGESSHNSTDDLYAFTVTTTADILAEFSKISYARLIGGCLLMMGYACLSLMRSRASRSQGAVGILGVLLVILSVAGGLGVCSFLGISFNAASTQVLPFLLLGLGVDDMFLMAHHFGEISILSHIPFQERTGECLKRVGVSVFLTSIAILSGFLFSLVIPMPALRSFGLQATIVTAFNLVSVLVIYPAILSLDLVRRKNNKLDIICCFDSSTANEVVDLQAEEQVDEAVCEQQPVTYYHHRPIVMTAPAENETHLPGQVDARPTEATITMRHIIETYPNNSFVPFIVRPTTETTVSGASSYRCENLTTTHPTSYPDVPRTPPPQYSASVPGHLDDLPTFHPPTRPRVAFDNAAMSEPSTTGYTTPINGYGSGRTSRRGFGSGPPTNLTTPMESVRGSTHSLVGKNRRRKSGWWRRCFGSSYACLATFPKLTLSQLGERYYAPLLLRKSVRIAVLIFFAALIGVAAYGATRVRDGLDFSDILPRGTREHSAVVAQTTYFSFQNMYIVTKSFDYASNQENIQSLHDSVGNLRDYVMKNTDGSVVKFWLEYFRDWLQDLQNEFDDAWSRGEVNTSTWIPQASDKTVLAYKLLLQTGKTDMPTDSGRIGCKASSLPCEKVNIVRLVSDDGVIAEDAFYNYLSAWVGNDPLTYSASEAQIRPAPKSWFHNRKENNMIIPRSSAIYFAQMPFYLNRMRETEDYVNVINWVRSLIDDVEKSTSVQAYPSGYPFLFWQQYITLRFWLLISLVCVISAVFLVLSLVLFNPKAAGIMALVLTMIAVELFGFMGLAGVKLSAVPAVILVAAIGLGVEFTVHVTFAFVTSCGSREERVRNSIGHMLGPVIDGSVSTLLGVIMLVVAEFDFVITYFFQVLAVLLLLGVLNGLVLLPVILSFIGPPSEVVPADGGNRLKTPTPPPSPTMEMDPYYHHPCCDRYGHNSPGHYYYQRRPTFTRSPQYQGSHHSSRDDLSTCHHHHRCHAQGRVHRRHLPNQQLRRPPRGTCQQHHPDYGRRNYARSQIDPYRQRPPVETPDPTHDGIGQVFLYPSAECIVYSSGASHPHEAVGNQHCENSSNSQPQPTATNQQVPTLTATSSLTVKLHSDRRNPVVAFVEPPNTSVVYPPHSNTREFRSRGGLGTSTPFDPSPSYDFDASSLKGEKDRKDSKT